MIAARLVVKFNRIPAAAGKLRSGIGPAVTQSASAGAGFARGYAAVDTGEMRDSIAHRTIGPTSAEFSAGTDHSLHVEFGTYKMAAQPFVRPAAEAVKPGLEAAIRSLLGGLA